MSVSLNIPPELSLTREAGGRAIQFGKNIVGWVEALRNPTNAAKCWVSFLNPTYTFLFFELNRTVFGDKGE